MKYRLKSDPSVTCVARSIPGTFVGTVRIDGPTAYACDLPEALFLLTWEPVPEEMWSPSNTTRGQFDRYSFVAHPYGAFSKGSLERTPRCIETTIQYRHLKIFMECTGNPEVDEKNVKAFGDLVNKMMETNLFPYDLDAKPKGPESCETCRFWHRTIEECADGCCRHDPAYVQRFEKDWCGKYWAKK